MLAAAQAHAMHAQARPAGHKLKSQQSQGASGAAENAAREAAKPGSDNVVMPSMEDRESGRHPESPAVPSVGGGEPHGVPA